MVIPFSLPCRLGLPMLVTSHLQSTFFRSLNILLSKRWCDVLGRPPSFFSSCVDLRSRGGHWSPLMMLRRYKSLPPAPLRCGSCRVDFAVPDAVCKLLRLFTFGCRFLDLFPHFPNSGSFSTSRGRLVYRARNSGYMPFCPLRLYTTTFFVCCRTAVGGPVVCTPPLGHCRSLVLRVA